jgi:uncharacterized damage-inducible protein DinB
MTADENFTLAMFYKQWREYQDKLKASVAPLTAEQLALAAGPGLRPIGYNVAHIIGCRAGWFTYTMGEDGGESIKALAELDEADMAKRGGAELAQGLDLTFDFMMSRISRWSDEDMRKTFEDDWDGVKVQLSRAWIVYHVMEHDLHHGGEVSMTLGMHGIPAEFTS